MCLFTHFAAGALAGGATGNVWAGAAAGLASHAVLDMIPHWDHPDWRVELAAGMASLLLLLLLPFSSAAAVVGGLMGMVPDLENLFQKLGWMGRGRFVFPTHTGLLPHGRALGPRSVVWQVAIFVGCFLLLGLLSPTSAQAATVGDARPVIGRPVVSVLQAADDRTVVQLTVPVTGEPVSWDAVDPRALAWPRAGWTGEDGRADTPPQWTLPVALPLRGQPAVRVLAVQWWKDPDPAAPAWPLVETGPAALASGVPVGGAVVALSSGGGILRRLTVEISHPADAFGREGLALADAKSGDVLQAAPAAPAGLLNPVLFGRLAAGERARAAAAAKADAGSLFGATSHWVRLEIDATGLYAVSGQDLAGWGVPTVSVDPTRLRLYRGGHLPLDADPEITDAEQPLRTGLTEVAVEVTGTGDGEWNLEDELRFYGVATSTWLDRFDPAADRLHHYDHPFASRAVYWLTWEDDATPSPLPGQPLRVAAAAAPAQGAPRRDWGHVRIHREEQALEGIGLVEDNFVWANTITGSRSETFTLANYVPGGAVRFSAEVRAAYWTASYEAEAWLNDDATAPAAIAFTSTTQTDSLRVRIIGQSTAGREGANVLTVRNTLTGGGQLLALDCFNVMAPCRLVAGRGLAPLAFGLWGDDVVDPGTAVDLVAAASSPGDVLLWDVTEPAAAVALTGDAATQQVTWGLVQEPGMDRHFVIGDASELPAVAAAARVTPVDLKGQGAALDYVVVAPSGFMNAAADLAAYRATDLPGVAAPAAAAVAVEDIYNNFSGGQKDPRAIRNYLAWLHSESGGRLAYACFLGNASRDPRNWKNKIPYQDLYDLVPTIVRTTFPGNPVYPSSMPWASDDELVSFDAAPGNEWGLLDYDLPDVACGRLPAIDGTEARAMVDRAIAMARRPEAGPWRNRALMVADDANRPGFSRPIKGIEPRHTLQAEELAENYVPRSVDVRKIFAVDYPFPPGSGVKSQVRAEINAALSEGTTLFYYVGHGAEDNLADEQLFRSQDIAGLVNGLKRFVFMAFSCDVGVYDSLVRRSMAEQFVAAPSGGAGGAICASQVSFVTNNEILSDAFFGNLYPGAEVDAERSFGQALLLAKNEMISSSLRSNSQRYTFFGDPALVLPSPEGGLSFAAASLDSLLTGQRHEAVLGAADVAAGDAYDLLAADSDQQAVFTCYDYYTDPVTGQIVYHNPTDYPWWRLGATVFRGTGTAGGGDLVVPFKAPLQLVRGERGRVRLQVEGPDEGRVAVAAVPVAAGSVGAADDVSGPSIALRFEDDRYRVSPGTQLEASLADTSGIAMVGTSPGNSIMLEFDDTGFMTDVTGGFAYDPDSYTSGRLAFGLPSDLDYGRHTVALYAADALGNVGSDTLSFELVPAGVADIASVSLFPNPTPGPCRLIFELSEPMTVRWDIYTVAGRLVRSLEEDFSAAGPRIVEWDGRDGEGDEIANGTYLYVLRGLGAARDGRDITRTGKLVVMR
jgi:hypothetical protein